MEEPGASGNDEALTILDVLEVDVCLRAILDMVHIRDVLRSERVSRRWQRAVLSYLQHCRSVKLRHSPHETKPYIASPRPHRTVTIKDNNYLPVIVNKLGSATTQLIVTDVDIAQLEIFGSNCPHLQHLIIYDLRCYPVEYYEGKYSSKIKKNVVIEPPWNYPDMTGPLIGLLKNDLKSLNLYISSVPLHYNMFTQAGCLWNLKSLKIKDFTGTMLMELSSLLDRMKNLENIDLTHGTPENDLSEELIDCFGKLVNLKSIRIDYINNALLETISLNCRRLTYLEISFRVQDGIKCWRGLALLIKRQSPGRTWLSFRHDITYETIKELNNELCLNGCEYLQITRNMWETARDIANQMSPYEVRLEFITHQAAIEEKCPELKIILLKTYLGYYY